MDEAIVSKYEGLNFLEKRQVILGWLLNFSPFETESFPIKNEISKGINNRFSFSKKNHYVNYKGMKVNEQHEVDGECISKQDEYFDGLNFNVLWNTRRIFPTEIRIEFESMLFTDNLKHFYDTCLNLIKQKIHFCAFYSLGQKCPHIIIYDLLPNGLDDDVSYQTRLLFCRLVVPMNSLAYLDLGMLRTGHKCQLEFSKHWRHGTMFKLLFEHIPGEENGSN